MKACEIELLTIFISLKARGLQEHNSSQVRSEWVQFLSIPYVLISSFFGTHFKIKTSDKILRFDLAEIIFKFIKNNTLHKRSKITRENIAFHILSFDFTSYLQSFNFFFT